MSEEITAPGVSTATFLRVLLDVLNAKALRWAVLLLSAAGFGVALWQPHWIRLVGACVFALIFALPAFWRASKS